MGQNSKLPLISIYSIIAAAWMIAFAFGVYLSGPAAFLSSTGYFAHIGMLVIAVIAVIHRKKKEGILLFQPAVRTTFVVFVVALAAQTLFIWILLHWIDPKFGQSLRPLLIIKNEALDRWAHLSEDQIRARTAEEAGLDPFALGGMLRGLALFYIVCFLFSLLIAAIVKTPGSTPGNTTLSTRS